LKALRTTNVALFGLVACILTFGCDDFGGVDVRVYAQSHVTLSDSCIEQAISGDFGEHAASRGHNPEWLHLQLPFEERPGRRANLNISTHAADPDALLEVQWTWDNFVPTSAGFAERISNEAARAIGVTMKRCGNAAPHRIRCEPRQPEKFTVPCPKSAPDAASLGVAIHEVPHRQLSAAGYANPQRCDSLQGRCGLAARDE